MENEEGGLLSASVIHNLSSCLKLLSYVILTIFRIEGTAMKENIHTHEILTLSAPYLLALTPAEQLE
jgi:hypothetical protein